VLIKVTKTDNQKFLQLLRTVAGHSYN